MCGNRDAWPTPSFPGTARMRVTRPTRIGTSEHHHEPVGFHHDNIKFHHDNFEFDHNSVNRSLANLELVRSEGAAITITQWSAPYPSWPRH
jgi:hypothetical protein